MAYQEISTGYKPEFALGALYQGYNAGNAMNASELANLKAEEELQYDRLNNPLRLIKENYEAANAQGKLDDPNYLPWQRAGQIGQMQTQYAAGKKAFELSDSDISVARQENLNKLLSGQLDYQTYQEMERQFANLRNGNDSQQSNNRIAFSMQEQPPSINRLPISGAQGPEGRVTRSDINTTSPISDRLLDSLRMVESGGGKNTFNPESGATGDFQFIPSTVEMLRKQGINFDPNNPQQARQAARLYLEQLLKQHGGDINKALAAYGGFVTKDPSAYVSKVLGGAGEGGQSSVLSNFESGQFGNRATPYSDLIPKTGVLAKMAGIRAIDPKFVGDMAKLEQRTDSAEDIAKYRADQMKSSAEAKNKINEPKYKEQLAAHRDTMVNYTYAQSQNKPISEEMYAKAYKANEWLRDHEFMLQIANPGNLQQRVNMQELGLPVQNSPMAQVAQARPSLSESRGNSRPPPPSALPPGVTRTNQ